MSSADRRAAIGRLRRPHGIRGEISVEPLFSGEPAYFVGRRLEVSAGPEGTAEAVTCDEARRHGERWLLRFAGIDTPEESRRLCGRTLTIDAAQLPSLGEEEAYHFELVGLLVVDREGREIGTVRRIDETPAGDLLVLDDEGNVMIPYRPMVVAVDRDAGRVVVELPEGLLDVNRR